MHKIWDYVKAHKWTVGGLSVVALLIIVMASKGSSSSSSSGGQSDAITAAQIQASTQLQAAQIAANAQASNTSAQADAAKSYLAAQVAMNKQNVQATIDSSLIQELGYISVNAPQVAHTTTKSSNGFLGIGAGSKSTTTYSANPAATQAGNAIAALEADLLGSGHGSIA